MVKSANGNFGKYANLDSITSKLDARARQVGPVAFVGHGAGRRAGGRDVPLAHVGGHSEEVTLSAPPDAGPGRNAIQALKSSTTYLCRITLLGVTGMATGCGDDDGQTADGDGPITAEQKDRPSHATAGGRAR